MGSNSTRSGPDVDAFPIGGAKCGIGYYETGQRYMVLNGVWREAVVARAGELYGWNVGNDAQRIHASKEEGPLSRTVSSEIFHDAASTDNLEQ